MSPTMPPPRFQIVQTGPVIARIQGLTAWANANGLADDLARALATVRYRLAYEADEWGEREDALPAPVTEIRVGTEYMLDVRYGIHYPSRQVFVTGLRWRDDYPGGRPPA